MSRFAPLAVLWTSACCATDVYDTGPAEITGTCVYGDAEAAGWCVNLWDGETSCAADSGAEGSWAVGGSCESRGYPYPCTYDAPGSAWVADEANCL